MTGAPPFTSYIICTAPRSGSTLLCGLLAATGVAGAPDSHFHEPSWAAWCKSYAIKPQDYSNENDARQALISKALATGRAGTPVFGLRMQRDSFDFFCQQIAQLVPHGTTPQHIETLFGSTRYIYLSRRDKLDQAISFVKARQTGLWHTAPDGSEIERLSPPARAEFDGTALTQHIQRFQHADQFWQDWFRKHAIDPVTVDYDTLSDDPIGTLASVLHALGQDPEQAKGVTIPVAKLADATNIRWAARYRAEYGEPSLPCRALPADPC